MHYKACIHKTKLKKEKHDRPKTKHKTWKYIKGALEDLMLIISFCKGILIPNGPFTILKNDFKQ